MTDGQAVQTESATPTGKCPELGRSRALSREIDMRLTQEQAELLVTRAASGDQRAWEDLIGAYSGLVWTIIRNHRLAAATAADVSQLAWLRLVENLPQLREPGRVGAWLATTTRHECLRVLAQSSRCVVVDGREGFDMPADGQAEVDDHLLAFERDESIREAMTHLSPRCQDLMRLLTLDPLPSYEEVSAATRMPIGSIGPTRGRCLAALHRMLLVSGTADR